MNKLSDYDFELPNQLIARAPLETRSASRLMVLKKHQNKPIHDQFKNIREYLCHSDVLVVNNTKVMKARLFGKKSSGGLVEMLLVRPEGNGFWSAMINSNGRIKKDDRYIFSHAAGDVEVIVYGVNENEKGTFHIYSQADLFELINSCGELPLPPYFDRKPEEIDGERYQTVFAKDSKCGAVAAPTAGLHFDKPLLEELKSQGIKIVEVTLHVGPGTFMPVRVENIDDHEMHSEFFTISKEASDTLNQARANRQRIIPVGTTSMRVLESVAAMAKDAKTTFTPYSGATNIFIKPGHKFLASDALITNFHLPKSTLLILVCAVSGKEKILNAYESAKANNYRFFSYGDACFLEIERTKNA